MFRMNFQSLAQKISIHTHYNEYLLIWIFEKERVLDDWIGPSFGTPQFPQVNGVLDFIRSHPNEWSVGFLLDLTWIVTPHPSFSLKN
jgi:hypothetical protein